MFPTPYILRTVSEGLANNDGGLVGPATSNVADCVAATTDHERGDIKALDERNAFRVALERKVERTKTITGKRVGAALKNNCARAVPLHYAANDLTSGQQK